MSQPQRTYAPETCAWCAGTGKRQISAGYVSSCLVCGGKGHISVTQPAQACHQCAGTGKRNVVNSCLACAGTGWSHLSGHR